jgi:hypothetical protein
MGTTALAVWESVAVVTRPDERVRVATLGTAVARIAAEPHGARVAAMTREALGIGMSLSTVRRAYYRWKRDGEAGLLDLRKQPKAAPGNAWLGVFMRYCENDLNTSANGHRAMMADFRSGACADGAPYGEVFGAVGTWREVWAREHPHERIPEAYPAGWVPTGASLKHLMRAASANPDLNFQLAISRRGRKAAHRFLQPVLTTRVGVPVGAIRQWDDVWHNFDVRIPEMRVVGQPLEFAGYDVASGYKCDSVVKPRFERGDGVRDNLKEQTFRFAVGFSHCVTGFHKDGITNGVEHGTAAIREPVRRQVALIPGYGRLIKWADSGILGEQAHAGLFPGCGGGNFRRKPLVESSHGVGHNMTAHLPGNRGRDAERMHESRGAMVRYEVRLMEYAHLLPADKAAQVEWGLLTFEQYLEAFRAVERRWMDDPEHHLEGWSANQVQEYTTAAVPAEGDWRHVRELLDMEPDRARTIAAFLKEHPECVRQRYMSRREVWAGGKADLVRVPLMEMPAFLDERDMLELTVQENGTVRFANGYFFGRDAMVYRLDAVRTPGGFSRRIAPGEKLFVKWNPFVPDWIWLIDRENGGTLGMAPLLERAPMLDQAAIERAMGRQSHDLATKIGPIRGRHQPEAERRARRMAGNQEALLGLARALPRTDAGATDATDDLADTDDAVGRAAAAFVEEPANA